MTHTNDTPPISPTPNKHPKHRVNWHEAATCAIQIELRDFTNQLEFQPEYILGQNSYRIDLLIIKKLSTQPIPKNIACIFRAYNLFEIKGIQSSITVSSYYKTIGYAGIFIDQISGQEQYSCLDISITFLSFRYPRKLMKHLLDERHLTVEKSSPGIYYIRKETFRIQMIVTHHLPPEENLYLRCLTNGLQDASLASRLADDYAKHQNQEIYNKYLHQLSTANIKRKGETTMVCEGLLNLFGTSSEEIIERAKKESDEYYLPKINELFASNEQLSISNAQLHSSNELLSSSNVQLSSSNKLLSSQIDYLKNLLRQNNIPFHLSPNLNEADIPNQY